MKECSNVKKIKFVIISILTIAVVSFISWWAVDQHKYAAMVDSPKDVKKWEADPRALQSDNDAERQLRNLKQATKADYGLMKTHATLVIPGLRGAWSINHKTGKAAFGTDWVPQGISQSKDYFFISMYDGKHKLNSIITLLSQKSGKYVKTLILKSTAHVGATSYDKKHNRLFWSDDNGKFGGAGFSYVDQKSINAYHANITQSPIASKRISWQLGSRTSAMTIYNNQLVVVKYGKKVSGRSIIAIELNNEGLPNTVTAKEIKAAIDAAIEVTPKKEIQNDPIKPVIRQYLKRKLINSYAPGWDRLQGIAIANNGITLLSQSNGSAPGKVYIQVPSGGNWSNLKFNTPTAGAKIVNVPNSVEEISLSPDNTMLAMAFESAARQYREAGTFFNRPQFMDRILVLAVEVA
jgi:hypothetical protein